MKPSRSAKTQLSTRANTIALPKLTPSYQATPLLVSSRKRIKTESQYKDRTGLSREGIVYGVHCERLIAEEARTISDLFRRIEEIRRENGLIAIDSED